MSYLDAILDVSRKLLKDVTQKLQNTKLYNSLTEYY